MRRFGNVKEFYLLRYNAVKSVERWTRNTPPPFSWKPTWSTGTLAVTLHDALACFSLQPSRWRQRVCRNICRLLAAYRALLVRLRRQKSSQLPLWES
jgi:hypothetical protein